MFDYLFSKRFPLKPNNHISPNKRYVPFVWSEHCMECSAPLCYTTCKRYESRIDGHCVRIKDGIKYEDGNTIIDFKSWGKIEALYQPFVIDGNKYSHLLENIGLFDKVIKFCIDACPGKTKRIVSNIDFSFRQKMINRAISKHELPKALMINIICCSNKEETMCFDIKTSKLVFRETFIVTNEFKEYSISIPVFDVSTELHFINLHPVNPDAELTLKIKEMELFENEIKQSDKKVKCCIWDLDNTLWNGVLIENRNVIPNYNLIDFIKDSDQKGIIHSICSKNTYEDASLKLEELGIRDYFVFAKINWNPKGQNIKQIVRQMNINPDSIIFIDDNPFERAEVSSCIDNITCIDPSDFLEYSKNERFDIKVSSESANRRKTYQIKEKLQEEEDNWTGNIDEFLISCKLKATLTHPDESNIERCFELLQRSNQLNSSGRRIPLEDLREIVKTNGNNCYVISADDKFGNYGIVGFIIINSNEQTSTITDFVISCRVANRKLEPTVINYLSSKYNNININFKQTLRNSPMKSVIDDLHAQKILSSSSNFEYDVYSHIFIENYPHIVDIEEKKV